MLLAIDKPTWISTFDIIRRLHKTYPKMKMGHCGTLDPLATGLVIIWTEKDTKQMTNIVWLDKTYIADIDFSQISDTWDVDFWEFHEQYKWAENVELTEKAEVTESAKWLEISKETETAKWQQINIYIWDEVKSENTNNIYKKIVWLLDSLIWTPELPLPTFSAKKIKGKKLYELWRQWIDAKQVRIMKVYSYEILSWEFPVLKVRLSVWSGTYIRSIAYWMGQELWLGGILSSLRRESIGKLAIDQLDMKYLELSDIYMSEVGVNDIL